MELDFYSQFNNYTTVELLAVIRRPEHYQPEAVAAAQQLLQERNVTPGDEEAADRHLLHLEVQKVARSAKNEHYKDKIMDAMQPIVSPRDEIIPARWFNIFVILFAIYYFWALYKFVKIQMLLLDCRKCAIDITIWGRGVHLLYLTVVFFFLLMNKRWAWILLAAGAITALFTDIIQIYVLVRYWHVLRHMLSTTMMEQLFPIIAFVFLMRRPIQDFFGIDSQTRKRTITAGCIAGLLYFIVLWNNL